VSRRRVLVAILAGAGLALGGERLLESVLFAGGDASEGGPALTKLEDPEGLAFGADGRLFVADRAAARIVVIDTRAKSVDVIDGPEPRGNSTQPPAVYACSMRGLAHLAVGPREVLFAQHDGHHICRYDLAEHFFSIVAGTWQKEEFGGDGGAASQAAVRVNGLASDAAGNIYFSGGNRIRRISRAGMIQTIAGTGKFGFFGDGGSAIAADLAGPSALAVDRSGTIYFSDGMNNRIRAIDRKGTIRTVAGNGKSGPPDDGDAIRNPTGEVRALAVDGDGDVVFMNDSRRIRRLLVSQNRMETLAANPFDVDWPREAPGLAVSPDGTIFFDVPKSKRVSAIPAALVWRKAR
jgi:DNA-binding beta-propeller fold protein YncE